MFNYFKYKFSSFVLLAVLLSGVLSSCSKTGARAAIGFRLRNVESKGSIISIDELKAEGTFITDAWVEEGGVSDPEPGSQHYIENFEVNYDAGSNKWALSTEKLWLSGADIIFWSWFSRDCSTLTVNNSKEDSPSIAASPATLTFSYSLPDHVDGGDADNQQDILFAMNRERYIGSGEKTIDIVFKHALCCVRFFVEDSMQETIRKIELTNIISAANGSFGEQAEGKGFTWTPGSPATKATVSQSFTANNLLDQNPFFLIPQTTGAETEIAVYFTKEGSNMINNKTFAGEAWEAGKYYTYRIRNLKGAMTVELLDYTEDGYIW